MCFGRRFAGVGHVPTCDTFARPSDEPLRARGTCYPAATKGGVR
jgi:hypothetical protein